MRTVLLPLSICLFTCCALAGTASAQQNTMSEIARNGLGLSEGKIEPGLGRRVRVRDSNGKIVVAEVHVQVGNRYVVMMPDGTLATVDRDGAPSTSYSFRPETKDEMIHRLKARVGPGFGTQESKHHYFLYDCSPDFQKEAAGVIESVHQGVFDTFKSWGFRVRQPPVPLPVIIFRTKKQFTTFSDMRNNINGYYNVLSNYIVLYEESDLGPEAAKFAREEVLAAVAHETVHQTLANIGVQPRLAVWPAWISEGLAEYFAPTIGDEEVKWKGTGEVNDLRMCALEPYFRGRRNVDGQMVARTVQANKLSSDGYGLAWALVHYLSKNRPATMKEYLRLLALRNPLELPAPEAGQDQGKAELDEFKKYFSHNLAGMEAGLLTHLRSLKFEHPLADTPHYVATIEYVEGNIRHRMVNMTVLSKKAELWKRETYSRLSPDEQSSFHYTVHAVPNRRAALEFATQWVHAR